MTAVVEAESLTKRFGEVSAVTDLSFALRIGEIAFAAGAADGRMTDPACQGIDRLLFLGLEPLAQRFVGAVPHGAAHARTTSSLLFSSRRL